MRMFRFLGENGEPDFVDIYRIVGFGHRWPTEGPLLPEKHGTVVYWAPSNCVILASSEDNEDLAARYEAQMATLVKLEVQP